jgi:hypothetical protein
VHDSVDDPLPLTLVLLSEQSVVSLLDRVTVPLKPFTALMLIVDEPATFGVVFTVDGLADIVKSTTWTLTVTAWCRLPFVPVTVAV